MLVLAILLLTLVLSSVQGQGDFTEATRKLFDHVDADGSNYVERPEIEEFFLEMDWNDDGNINRHEFWVFLLDIDQVLADHHNDLFSLFDINSDHHVNKADFDIGFVLHDWDGDGRLSYQEFARP